MAPARRLQPTAASDALVEPDAVGGARDVYRNALVMAESLWKQANEAEAPDASTAARIVDDLCAVMARDAGALMTVVTTGNRPTYMFSHMVNVAALTLAQAAELRIDGPLLRTFGVAGLLHDIGKVRTPVEILFKPEALTHEEFEIVKRHVLDGAAILRHAPGMSPLAAVVAFEHHLKQDLSGYPEHTGIRAQNACTQLVVIADFFDALRSDRPYRRGMPSARVRVLMQERKPGVFNAQLLARFAAMLERFDEGR